MRDAGRRGHRVSNDHNMFLRAVRVEKFRPIGGRKPADLVGTPEEQKLIDVLKALDQGLF